MTTMSIFTASFVEEKMDMEFDTTLMPLLIPVGTSGNFRYVPLNRRRNLARQLRNRPPPFPKSVKTPTKWLVPRWGLEPQTN